MAGLRVDLLGQEVSALQRLRLLEEAAVGRIELGGLGAGDLDGALRDGAGHVLGREAAHVDEQLEAVAQEEDAVQVADHGHVVSVRRHAARRRPLPVAH